ncbi:hypothetical protein [Spiroplasma endosymbiont of Acasis viretata]|uniref:hypothetical protein n=1 Tax=Spiroplasma endosymbiont of Acasis viretata TaxID=3066306 RepID=UPI00313DFE14
MQSNNYKSYKKGMGILVCIPGDEHNGIQSKRPGIVLSSHPNYIVIQLLSTQPSDHDLGTRWLALNYWTIFDIKF